LRFQEKAGVESEPRTLTDEEEKPTTVAKQTTVEALPCLILAELLSPAGRRAQAFATHLLVLGFKLAA
jgi:hypothetical protein